MRNVNEIILHCSATKEGMDFNINDIRRWHVNGNGWEDVGYHYIIKLDGEIQKGRDIEKVGAHCKGRNKHSIGICYIGGLDGDGKPKDTRTDKQKASMYMLIERLRNRFGNIPVYGHNKFANKSCPCFDAEKEYNEVSTDTCVFDNVE